MTQCDRKTQFPHGLSSQLCRIPSGVVRFRVARVERAFLSLPPEIPSKTQGDHERPRLRDFCSRFHDKNQLISMIIKLLAEKAPMMTRLPLPNCVTFSFRCPGANKVDLSLVAGYLTGRKVEWREWALLREGPRVLGQR